MDRYVLIAATLGLTVFGQLVSKARSLAHVRTTAGRPLDYVVAMFTDLRFLSGLAAALLASVCWILAIQKLQLSTAYPFMALSFVLVPIGSAWLFGDRLSPMQMFGGILIVAGVALSATAP